MLHSQHLGKSLIGRFFEPWRERFPNRVRYVLEVVGVVELLIGMTGKESLNFGIGEGLLIQECDHRGWDPDRVSFWRGDTV